MSASETRRDGSKERDRTNLDGVEPLLVENGGEDGGERRDEEEEEEADDVEDGVTTRHQRPLSRFIVDLEGPSKLVDRRSSHVEVVGG